MVTTLSILIINYYPHDVTPYEYLYAQLNKPLVMLTSQETASGYPMEAYTYFEAFEDFPNNSEVIERAIHLHQKYQFESVVALHEFDLLRAAKLRELLNIKGQSFKSATHFRDKVIMKEKVAEYGLRVPKHKRLTSVNELLSFIKTNGYPIIVKPISGAGTIGANILRSPQDLEQFLIGNPDLSHNITGSSKTVPHLTELEVEEYITGTLHHIDGIVLNGEVAFICASQYLSGTTTNFKKDGILASWHLHPSNPLAKRLFAYTKEVLKALDTPLNTTFHCELFHTGDDDIVLCEIASRCGGARVGTCTQNTFGVNLFHTFTRLQVGFPTSIPNNGEDFHPKALSSWVLFTPIEGILRSIPKEDPPKWVTEYRILGKVGQVYSDALLSVDHFASVVLEGKSEQECNQRIYEINDWFTTRVEWE